MVKQKDDWGETREAEVWQLLKSYLAGESDPAGLAQELLCLLAQEDNAAPGETAAKPIAPEPLPKTKLREPAMMPLPDGLSMSDLVRRLIDNAADDGETAARLKDFLHKYIE